MIRTEVRAPFDRTWAGGTLRAAGACLVLASGLVAGLAYASSAPKLIVVDMASDDSGDAAAPENLARHMSFIETTGIDGVAVNTQAGWDLMLPGRVLDYDDVYENQLGYLKGKLTKVNTNFLTTYVMNVDPFDSWKLVIDNWVTVARAARDIGMVGLIFDNEAYNGNVWTYPQDVRYASRYTLAAYQERYRQRARELMHALAAVWPTIQFLTMHGPYVSDPRTPASVVLGQSAITNRDLSGFFFAGLLEAAPSTAAIIDGGEVYQYRTEADFKASYRYRKSTLPTLQPSALVPSSMRGTWSEKIDISFGVYDEQWKAKYPMNPAILETTLANALRQADSYVWLYAEQHNYLKPGGVGAEWSGAVRRAMAAAAR